MGYFEIGISVIVEHTQSIGIIRAFCLPVETCSDFKYLGGQKKLLGCGLLGEIITQGDTVTSSLTKNALLYKYFLRFLLRFVAIYNELLDMTSKNIQFKSHLM